MITIAAIPLYNVFFEVVLNRDLEGIYFVHFIFGIIGIIITTFYSIMISLIYMDENFSSV